MKEIVEKVVMKTGFISLGGLRVKVVVTDVKERWGKYRYLVSPVAGTGEVWVESVTLQTA